MLHLATSWIHPRCNKTSRGRSQWCDGPGSASVFPQETVPTRPRESRKIPRRNAWLLRKLLIPFNTRPRKVTVLRKGYNFPRHRSEGDSGLFHKFGIGLAQTASAGALGAILGLSFGHDDLGYLACLAVGGFFLLLVASAPNEQRRTKDGMALASSPFGTPYGKTGCCRGR
ncbi:hypothetical protein THIX_60094 [Thiomonas sp. X19]|nr:hypothetical protein THIX_60094 [Thiomonas sp. X19]